MAASIRRRSGASASGGVGELAPTFFRIGGLIKKICAYLGWRVAGYAIKGTTKSIIFLRLKCTISSMLLPQTSL